MRTASALLVALFVTSPTLASAQAKGPSLAETRAWLEREAPALLVGTAYDAVGSIASTMDSWTTSISIVDCRMTVRGGRFFELDRSQRKGDTTETVVEIPLKDLDVNGVVVLQDATGDPRHPDPNQRLRLRTSAQAGATIRDSGWKDQPRTQAVFIASHAVDANRVAAAVRWAAILCGAVAGPF